MKTVTVRVSTNKVGSESTDDFEIDDDASDEDIEAEAKEVMLNLIEWNYEIT